MGTPAFARDILAGLLDNPDFNRLFEVVCVYTRPDRPAGRGKKISMSPVKELALSRGVEVRQPLSFKKDAEERAYLASLAPDFLVVAAYGMILPPDVLASARLAPVNVHTSLLPAYRGSAPVQRALMDGLDVTGVSVMRMEEGLDTGPVYASFPVETGRFNTETLLAEMAGESVPVLVRVLKEIADGTAVASPQEGPSTYAAKILAGDGVIDFSRPVRLVDGHIRGVTPDPGAHATLDVRGASHEVTIEDALPCALPEGAADASAGEVWASRKKLQVICADGALDIRRIKPQGRKSMDAVSFLNGLRLGLSGFEAVGRVVSNPPAGEGEK